MSDTHLGYSAYSKLDPDEGINQREADFYRAFKEGVDRAIALKPDAVIHAGDLFDTVRPQNRAIDFALKQLIRLSEARIETVLISGNHSTPRLRETGTIFRIFDHLPHVHSVYEPGVTTIQVKDGLTIHAVPHSTTPTLTEVVQGVEPAKDARYNVLVLHAGILDSKTYKMDEFNEQDVPAGAISKDFDYVALGHYHRFTEVRKGMFYSGSTERLTFGELGQTKGVVEVDLETGKTELHEIATRKMLELDPIDASDLTSSEIFQEARQRISASRIDGCIVRMIIGNVKSEAYRALDLQGIRRLASSAMHFEPKIERAEDEGGARTEKDFHIGSLAHEYRSYVSGLDIPEAKKDRLRELGLPYFAEGEE